MAQYLLSYPRTRSPFKISHLLKYVNVSLQSNIATFVGFKKHLLTVKSIFLISGLSKLGSENCTNSWKNSAIMKKGDTKNKCVFIIKMATTLSVL